MTGAWRLEFLSRATPATSERYLKSSLRSGFGGVVKECQEGATTLYLTLQVR